MLRKINIEGPKLANVEDELSRTEAAATVVRVVIVVLESFPY